MASGYWLFICKYCLRAGDVIYTTLNVNYALIETSVLYPILPVMSKNGTDVEEPPNQSKRVIKRYVLDPIYEFML